MANNVTNIIELRGKPELVQELLNSIGNDEYGSGSISFEKIIPMPGNLYMGAIPRDGTKPYRTAGICALIAGASSVLAAIVNGGSEGATWILIFTIPAAIVALVGEYNEYMAHSAVLSGVDNELSEKWEVLWKWYIGLFGVMIGSILVMIIIPILGALAILAAAIGTIVVSILKLVYLYRTAKIFREYPVRV